MRCKYASVSTRAELTPPHSDIALQHEESEASDAEDEGDEQGTKKKKKRESVRRASRAEKHQALELHRSHLLTLLAHALHGSTLADDQTLQASVLSLFAHSDISVEHDCEKEFLQSLTHLADWFASTFTISQSTAAAAIDLTVEVSDHDVERSSQCHPPLAERQARTQQEERCRDRRQVASPD